MGESVRLPGPRDCRGTLDEASVEASGREDDACVVACPPHPQLGGSRSDTRLRAVAGALGDRGVDCLRFDYGPWDHGRGEQTDVVHALEWAGERYERVGLFGYSFGAGVALCAAADASGPLDAVAVLAPPASLDEDDVADCVGSLRPPLLVVVGERDVTVDSGPVANAARDRGAAVEVVPGDHHFVGQADRIAETVATFLDPHLRNQD